MLIDPHRKHWTSSNYCLACSLRWKAALSLIAGFVWLVMQSTLRPTSQNISLNAPADGRQIHVYWPEHHGGKFEKDLVVFGPNYMDKDWEFWKKAKKEGLEHVLKNSQYTKFELMNGIATIEAEARAAYGDNAVNDLTGATFQEIMAEDGCFFLLLAFSILGAGAQLKFSMDHLIFGVGCEVENMSKWLESMFFVGNQIPFLVLEKLMELSFFQELKRTNQWKQPLELEKRTLYKFLMVRQQANPLDLIHCLQLVILGTICGSTGAVPKVIKNGIETVPSAGHLSEQGIEFKKLEGDLGSRAIYYERFRLNGVLYLPVFRVNRHTKLMVECLRKYEAVQLFCRGIEPEVSYYFKFFSMLIHTARDIETLSHQGVIQGQSDMLLELGSIFDGILASEHLCTVYREMRENPPLQWRKHIKLIAITASFLGLFFQLSATSVYHP